jgi:hypothetical protein
VSSMQPTRGILWLVLGGSALLAVVACGGGGDNSNRAPAPPSAPPLVITTTSLPDGKESQSYQATLAATGGSGTRTWAISGGTLPEGLNLQATTGAISGVPSKAGVFSFTVQVTDSNSPPSTVSKPLSIAIASQSALGRNDSIASATKLKTNGNSTVRASLSPYGDPPGNANPDTDFYQLTAKSGAVVTVETRAKRISQFNPLNSAIEIVDQNGVRFTSCRDEGDLSGVDGEPDPTPNAFDDLCVNDDVEVGLTEDSKVKFKVPNDRGDKVTFYIHVLDWSGGARPDMIYELSVRGAE